ncbi:MAG: 4-hydroxy-tetrahydrodipicolinate synthase [Bacteroidales bacterium]|nr:4-hydroxy-tetrahydrodipicolinate synthase [Bacteroidales bacterium]
MKWLRGTGVAIVTPFKNDSSIDFSSLGKIIDHVIKGGVNYIVALGTTGESVTLSMDEKHAVISHSLETINKRVPLVVGIGGNNTQEITDCIRRTDLTSVDAILSVSPYYNKPNQRGIYQHYKTIAASSPVPVILYNVPSRTGSNITAETCIELAHDCDNITAVKEASGDFNQIMKILRDKPEDFLLISGDDMNALPVIASGGAGVISVLANAFPGPWSEMVSFALKSNLKSAREIQYKYLEFIEMLFADGSPAGVKAMLFTLGLCHNNLRLPLVPVNRSLLTKIQKAMETIS